ncbi:hypothetical protein M426DRAFT_260331 [Hypoxylon sp. CI-4A]|nr:hypothetical protein M426DRAFT_260331 [Hypoxylon sp. CI-4A]
MHMPSESAWYATSPLPSFDQTIPRKTTILPGILPASPKQLVISCQTLPSINRLRIDNQHSRLRFDIEQLPILPTSSIPLNPVLRLKLADCITRLLEPMTCADMETFDAAYVEALKKEYDTKLAEKDAEIAKKDAEINDLRAELGALSKTHDELRKNMIKKRDRARRRGRDHHENIVKADNIIDGQKAQASGLKAQNSGLEARVADLEIQLSDSEAQVSDLEERLATVRRMLD